MTFFQRSLLISAIHCRIPFYRNHVSKFELYLRKKEKSDLNAKTYEQNDMLSIFI